MERYRQQCPEYTVNRDASLPMILLTVLFSGEKRSAQFGNGNVPTPFRSNAEELASPITRGFAEISTIS